MKPARLKYRNTDWGAKYVKTVNIHNRIRFYFFSTVWAHSDYGCVSWSKDKICRNCWEKDMKPLKTKFIKVGSKSEQHLYWVRTASWIVKHPWTIAVSADVMYYCLREKPNSWNRGYTEPVR